MTRACHKHPAARTRRATWSWTVLTVAVTVWAGKWVAVTLEPSHPALYLAVVVAFVLSTVRPIPGAAG